jgi:O-antigen/teichoic acid export membrane protein
MIAYMRLFAVIGILFPINSMNNQLMYALGKSRLNFNIGLITNSLRLINIMVMINLGVFYIIIGEVFLAFVNVILYSFFTKKYISYGLLDQINSIKFVIIGAVTSAFCGLAIYKITNNNYYILVGATFVVLGIYFLFHLVFNNKQIQNFKNLFDLFLKRKNSLTRT